MKKKDYYLFFSSSSFSPLSCIKKLDSMPTRYTPFLYQEGYQGPESQASIALEGLLRDRPDLSKTRLKMAL
jgi:hypothetical protein